MIKQPRSPISLATLILCLCLGSLAILPIINVVGLPVLEISGIDSQNYTLFEQTEADDDLLVGDIVGVTIAGLSFSKSKPMSLDFQSASLVPVSPPPKSA